LGLLGGCAAGRPTTNKGTTSHLTNWGFYTIGFCEVRSTAIAAPTFAGDFEFRIQQNPEINVSLTTTVNRHTVLFL
jgi:hypothetical protein